MAEQYISITHKNKSGEVKTIKYRVDAGFVPTRLDEICEEFIQNYCLANDKEDWLDNQYNSKEKFVVKKEKRTINKVVYKKGETYETDKSFISIRRDFGKEFFGISKADTTKKRGRDLWAEKKQAKKKK